MKIGIVGGGPAGLYIALLMRRSGLAEQVQVVEQNSPTNTYGWGVVFSGGALSFLQESDARLYADIQGGLERWEVLTIVHRGRRVPIRGNAFSGIARVELLRILQDHCRRAGVWLEFEQRVTDLDRFADCDLVVGADGVNSFVRDSHRDRFGTWLDVRPNKYAWYGTRRRFDALTLTFRENEHGIFIGHAYRYDREMSTFIVECDARTWEQAGLESMTDEESRRYCEQVFADDLEGHPLLSNRSIWSNFAVVHNRRWSHANVVLIGDALHTVHFSIGSGTRNALEDAVALYTAFQRQADVRSALHDFEQIRRPGRAEFDEAARRSFLWYENLEETFQADPTAFAYAYMTRTGVLDHESLRMRAPDLVAAYEAQRE